jgi:hypothetical protein
MKLMGFNFTKLSVEKFSDNLNQLKIDTNIKILEIKKVKQDFFKSKEEFLGVEFTFGVSYSPKIADLEFKGKILLSVDFKKSKDILKDWEEKKINEEFQPIIFNLILSKSSIKALQFEEEMNLPPHVNLPRVSKKENKDSA